MKNAFRLLFLATSATACFAQTTAPAHAPDLAAATKKLGAFVGQWKSEGSFSETPYSHKGKVTSDVDCRWSPQNDFLVCEQLITDPEGRHIQLSIFSYNSETGKYTISSMAGPGKQPWNGTVVIEGTLWTYPPDKTEKVQFRTINDFSVPGTEVFKTEFSSDGGEHWTTMLEGKAKKLP
ncbi:MAG TPA: hypothetical protein VG033_09540 [Candidatus Acidoferrales bacterium]|jgi:hypothetical protein|nr:hypothetical protein [Candidatus Acidoferrales bacterium]